MVFNILLGLSLLICITGIVYRFHCWIRPSKNLDPISKNSIGSHIIKPFFSILFSPNILLVFKSFILDVLLLRKSLKTSPLRWIMHFLIFTGFSALVLMHAMDTIITEQIFPYYYSTIDPFLFLRSLFGLMVFTGLALAVFRRYVTPPWTLKTSRSDLTAILIIGLITLSGVGLEGMKMVSISEFKIMVEDYAGLDYDDEDVQALEAYWVKDYGLVSERISRPFDPDVIALGIEIHEESCIDCHSPNSSGFLGFAAASLISPVALFLDRIHGVDIMYYFHILCCFTGLALVPFTKMFHIITTPLSLMNSSIESKKEISFGSNFKQFMQLDACTHCSTCNLNCSALMMADTFGNEFILPSQKIQALKKLVHGEEMTATQLQVLFQGLYLCSNCNRCTVVCPSGINLKNLWFNIRELMIENNTATPEILTGFSFFQGLNRQHLEGEKSRSAIARMFGRLVRPVESKGTLVIGKGQIDKTEPAALLKTTTFSHCFGCQSCSTICPVVAGFDLPEKDLTLLPHQMMYSLGLGMNDTAMNSAMIWNCLSCYQCQETCPQNVAVCDIIFLLKNRTFHMGEDNPQ